MNRTLFLALFCLVTPLLAQEPRGLEVTRAVDKEIERLKTARGGSLTLEPALLKPLGSLEDHLDSSLGYSANFDVGVTPRFSWVFGASWFEFTSLRHRDMRLRFIPAWMGVRVKYRIPPVVESWWEVAGAGYYEGMTFRSQSAAIQEHLVAGGVVGTGINYNLSKWFMTGAQFRMHFVVEERKVYPMMQFGLLLGIRG